MESNPSNASHSRNENLIERLQALGEKASSTNSEETSVPEGVPAAVLAPLVLPDWKSSLEQARLLFIKRSEHLKKHPGQIAFPGGVAEPSDPDLLSTGYREGLEEVGFQRERSRVIARLPQAFTPTGYRLQPFFVATTQNDFTPQDSEVQSIHLITVQELLQCPVRLEHRTWQGREYRVIYFETSTVCVWGVTGRITELLLSTFFDWTPPR